MEHPIEHPEFGKFNVLAQAVRMSGHDPRTGMPTPDRGQHTDEVLAEFGYGSEEIADLRKREVI